MEPQSLKSTPTAMIAMVFCYSERYRCNKIESTWWLYDANDRDPNYGHPAGMFYGEDCVIKALDLQVRLIKQGMITERVVINVGGKIEHYNPE